MTSHLIYQSIQLEHFICARQRDDADQKQRIKSSVRYQNGNRDLLVSKLSLKKKKNFKHSPLYLKSFTKWKLNRFAKTPKAKINSTSFSNFKSRRSRNKTPDQICPRHRGPPIRFPHEAVCSCWEAVERVFTVNTDSRL